LQAVLLFIIIQRQLGLNAEAVFSMKYPIEVPNKQTIKYAINFFMRIA
jgi:hypothetical protein